MATSRPLSVILPAHLVEMLGLAPNATFLNRLRGDTPIETDDEVAAALVAFLERHHDLHFGATAKRLDEERRADDKRRDEERRAAQEREWLEDPERSIGGSFAPDYFKR